MKRIVLTAEQMDHALGLDRPICKKHLTPMSENELDWMCAECEQEFCDSQDKKQA